MRKKRKWRMRLMSLVLGLSVSIVLSEYLLRVLGVGWPQLYQPDPFCGSRLRPNVRGVWTSEGYGQISINAIGFRGPEIELRKPANTTRICMLGDSFIEALQVNYEDSCCAQLHQGLTERAMPQSPKYQVVNCGVSGYGTAQQWLMLKHYVFPLEPDIVMLAFYPENDVRNNHPTLEEDPRMPFFSIDAQGQLQLDASFRQSLPYLLASSRYEQTKAAWVNRSRILQLIQQVYQRQPHTTGAVPPSLEEQLVRAARDARYIYSEPATAVEHEAWKVTERIIAEMATQCRERHIRFIVFSVSTSLQALPDQAVRQQVKERCGIEDLFYAERRLQSWCNLQQIEFIPLASAMQKLADEKGAILHGFANSQLGLGHWSVQGNRAAAQILTDQLVPQ